MKTAEEKATEYAESEIPIAYTDETKRSYIEELRQDVRTDYLAGYAEAMRWRDPKEELPKNQEIVLVKSDNGCYATAYCHGKSGCFIDYGRDAYVDFGEIIGWRPIE